MEETEHREPWVELETMVRSGDADQLDDYLEQLPPGEPARALSRLDEQRQAEVVGLLPEEDAAALLTELPDPQAAQILEQLAPDQAAAIVNEVVSNQHDEEDAALEAELIDWLAKDAENWTITQMAVLGPWETSPGYWRPGVPQWVVCLGTNAAIAHF